MRYHEEGVRDRNRAGIEAADHPVPIRIRPCVSELVPDTHTKYPYLTETGALDRKSDWAQADEVTRFTFLLPAKCRMQPSPTPKDSIATRVNPLLNMSSRSPSTSPKRARNPDNSQPLSAGKRPHVSMIRIGHPFHVSTPCQMSDAATPHPMWQHSVGYSRTPPFPHLEMSLPVCFPIMSIPILSMPIPIPEDSEDRSDDRAVCPFPPRGGGGVSHSYSPLASTGYAYPGDAARSPNHAKWVGPVVGGATIAAVFFGNVIRYFKYCTSG
eukprot:gene20556-biopygen923